MALTDKLTAIADAIRAKTGKTEPMTLDEMPAEIAEITTSGTSSAEELLPPTEVLDYIRPEVLELFNKVKEVKTDDSITFIALSDSHYPADQDLNFYDEETIKSTTQANMATKILAYILDLDFIAHLGDVSSGDKTTTPDVLKTQIEGFNAYFKEACNIIPCFVAIGNHDAGYYYNKEQNKAGNTGVYTMTGQYLYNNFTKYSESDNTVIAGKEYGGYCYRDFEDKKLRVFLLNTSESIVYDQTDNATLGSQRLWFANALLDLNSKTDATDWQFIILCHYPADYGANMPLSELLKAYVEGSSISIVCEDSTSSTIDFSGNNVAKLIAQFHGHVHNFKTAKLNSYATGSAIEYDAWRVCIPNGQYNRENYYTEPVGNYTDIYFNESQTYAKTVDTAEGTSFVVNVINPSEKIIHSFCYGAGYDRVIGYGSITYYSITTVLSNTTSSNEITSIEEGQEYTTTITVDAGCDMTTLTITMGGIDITSDVYVDGVITIPEVTGNVVITAKAQARPNFTNLVPTSIDTDRSTYNGTGYKDGYSLGSSGSETRYSGYVVTGYIELPADGQAHTLRLGGEGITWDTYGCQMVTYNSEFVKDKSINYQQFGSATWGTWDTTEDTAFTLTWVPVPGLATAKYLRISAKGSGVNIIVTVDEEITYGANTNE